MNARPWSDFFNSQQLMRAQSYLDGNISILDWEFSNNTCLQLTAHIDGSANIPYVIQCTCIFEESTVENHFSFPKVLELSCDCTCPAKNPCKHAAACLILAERDPEIVLFTSNLLKSEKDTPQTLNQIHHHYRDNERAEIDAFLDQIQGNYDENKEHYRYVLAPLPIGFHDNHSFYYNDEDSVYSIAIYRTYKLKKGTWSESKPLRDLDRFLAEPTICANSTDIQIIDDINSYCNPISFSPGNSYKESHLAVNKLLADVLSTLIDSKRLHWLSLNGPVITHGGLAQGKLRWSGKANRRNLKLHFDINGLPQDDSTPKKVKPKKTSIQLLPFASPYYIDLNTMHIGPAVIDAPPHIINKIDEMPPFHDDDVQDICHYMHSLGHALKPPKNLEISKISDPIPVACFHNCVIEYKDSDSYYYSLQGNSWKCLSQCVIAAVRYGDDVLLIDPQQRKTTLPDKRVINRNPQREQEFLDTLNRFQIESFPEQYLHVQMKPEMRIYSENLWIPIHKGMRKRRPPQPDKPLLLPETLAAELLSAGWEIDGTETPETLLLSAQDIEAHIEEQDGNFSMRLRIATDDKNEQDELDIVPALLALLDRDGFADSNKHIQNDIRIPLASGQILQMPADPLRRILVHVRDLFTRKRSKNLDLNILDHHFLDRLDDLGISHTGGEHLKEIATSLKAICNGAVEKIVAPKSFKGTLRAYQEEGISWMHALHSIKLGGILADDMGLGKTVMTLAYIAYCKRHKNLKKGALIIAPRSMLLVWQREAERFTPQLSVRIYHGTQRMEHHLQNNDIICTTYAIAQRDAESIKKQHYDMIICDEAQSLKNTATKSSKAIRSFNADWRLALSGTPIENHLGELWSIMHWLNPGLLGSQKQFNAAIRKPIEQDNDSLVAEQLQQRIAPILLRRSKDAVATELPEKTSIERLVELGPRQRECYESIRASMDTRLQDAIAERGFKGSSIFILEALMRLRQVCCDPLLLKTPAAKKVKESTKLEALKDMLPTLIDDGRRILLFSQFTEMLDIISMACTELEIPHQLLTGKTNNRQSLIDAFQAEEFPLFLISLKAGGTGLTLTAADTVIHYDPWWNPAVEDQATDRAHRIGQKKNVMVYKLITADTVEERIQSLQARKRSLASGLYNEDGQVSSSFNASDVEMLLQPMSNN